MDNKKDIELRSEKVRNIVGKIPPVTLRIGIAVISIVIILILVLAYFLPYPQYYNTDIEIISTPEYQIVRAPASGLYFNNSGNRLNIGIVISSDSIFQVKSNAGGKIVTNNCDSFYVYQNDIIAVIIPDTTLSILGICKIPTDKINKIKQGQRVNVSLSSGENYLASVSEIDNILQKDRTTGYPYYKVMIQFDSKLDLSEIFDTMAEGKIFISEKSILKLILQ